MLEELDDTSIETQRRWLRFILERVGHNNLPKLIDYYRSIGWINESAANRLLALAAHEKRYNGNSWTLSAEEHRISRLYIEKLKGKQIDESILSVHLPARVKPDPIKKIERTGGKIHPVERKKIEFTLHRREVTIKNLEQELKERDIEIGKLNERIVELEAELTECQKEIMRNRIYMEILDQNIRIRKAHRVSSRASQKSDMINHVI